MNTNKKLILSIIIVAIISLIGISSVYFLSNKINNKKNTLINNQKQLLTTETKIKNANLLETNITKLEEPYHELEKIFIGEKDVVDFIKNLEYLAQKANIDLSIKKADITQKEGHPSFNLSLEGSFSNIYYYLLLLENDIHYTNIKKINMWVAEENTKKMWTAAMELELLNFKND